MMCKMAVDCTPIYRYLATHLQQRSVTLGSMLLPDGGESLEVLNVVTECALRATLSGELYQPVMQHQLSGCLLEYMDVNTSCPTLYHTRDIENYRAFIELVNDLSTDRELEVLLRGLVPNVFVNRNGMAFMLTNVAPCVWYIYGNAWLN